MSTPTYTVAQALQTMGTGITVADSPANIASVVGNFALIARVTQFTMIGDDAIDAYRAEALSSLGGKFTRGSYNLTVRDTVASLTNPANTQGLAVGNIVQVVDTIENLLPMLDNPVIRAANTLSLTDDAVLTRAQLLKMESWQNFTATGVTIVLADTAANLLAITPAQTKPALKVYAVCIDSSVSATDAATLYALPGFMISLNIKLTIADSLANISSFTTAHASMARMTGVVLSVADSVAHLIGGSATLTALLASYSGMTVMLAGSETVSSTQLASLAAIAHFSAGAGHTLTVADSMTNLLALTTAQKALVQASHLLSGTTASVAQLQQLAALPAFSAGTGNQLLVSDNASHVAGLTVAQVALLSGIAVDDTVAALVAAFAANPPAAAAISSMTAHLDGGAYTVAQLAPLAAQASLDHLSVVPNGAATALNVVDTLQHLAAGATALDSLGQAAASLSVTATDDHSILSASAAANLAGMPNFDLGAYTLAVSDTGPAIAAVAGSIFQHGFQAITVTSGIFAGPLADLLDPTLRFLAGGSAAAQLVGNASVNATTLAQLAGLPNFSVAGGTSLTVQDTASDLAANEALVAQYASQVQLSGTATIGAAAATELAALRDAVGAVHFQLGGNFLVLSDNPANLLDPANSAGIALANSLTLAGDAHVNAAQAAQLVALADKFAPGDAELIVADSGANLAALASNAGTLVTLNGWQILVMLGADSTLSVAGATPLAGIAAFSPGAHHLILSDTAQALLHAPQPLLSIAYALQLSQPDTIAVADATALLGGHTPYVDANPLIIADTPVQLAALSPMLAGMAAGEALVAQNSDNAAGFVVNASQLAALLALPNFDASGFGGQVKLADVPSVLLADAATLANLPAGLAGNLVPALSADAVVSVSQAEALSVLAGFTLDGHSLTISDTGLNIAGLDSAARALATDIQVTGSGGAAYSAADFLTLTHASNFDSFGAVQVSDSAMALLPLASLSAGQLSHISGISVTAGDPLTAAQAQALSTLPNLAAGVSVAVVDSAGNLLQGSGAQPDNWAGELLAGHVTLTGDVTLTAAQATQLAQLGYRFDNGSHAVVLQDTPAALIAAVSAINPIAGQIGTTLLAHNATPWAVSIQQAEQLAMLPHLQADAASAVIADNPANILAPVNAPLVAQAPAVTLDGDYTVSVQTAQSLHGLTHFNVGTHGAGIANHLTISDGAGHLATLDAATAAMASAIQLQGNSIASVAQFDSLRTLPNFTANGKLLLISDTAANLLTLSGTDVHLASAIMLASDPSDLNLSAGQAQLLASLPGFTPGIAQIGVLDSAAHLLNVSGAGPMPDDWAGELAASTVTLSQDGTVSATQAAELALLGSRFSVGSHTLTVSDSAAQLTAMANMRGLALAGHIQLAGPETLTAADATRLAAVAGLDKASHAVTVLDSAANLAFAGFATGVALADSVQLNAATSLTAAAAEALIGLANYAPNAGAPLAIADTLPNLLGLASASLAHNTAVLLATPIGLAGDTVASVAQMAALAALPESALFSRNGHALTVADSGRHLANYTPGGISAPTVCVLTGDATLTAAQADHLAALGVQLDDNLLTVADIPSALLSAANAAGLALADALVLSANASVSASVATQLAGLPNFSDGGHTLTVSDVAQALIGLDGATQQMATALSLADTESVDVATLRSLTQFGVKFSVSQGHTLSVADSAAHLSALNDLETALTNAQVLNTDATVTSAVAAQLALLPHLALGSGVHLTVQDSVANLIALPSSVRAVATAEQLPNAAQVTISVADAAALAALPHFSDANASITVDDSIAALSNVANFGWQSVSTQYVVTDSVSNLLSDPTATLLLDASGVKLLGDTQVDPATFAQLAAIAHFEPGNARLTVVGGPAAIAANAAAIGQFATIAQVDASTAVSAADAELLAGLEGQGILSFATGVHLAVQDSYAALTLPANADGLGLANTITVLDNIGQLTTAMQHDWNGQNPYYVLSADGSVSGVQAAVIVAHSNHFSLNSHTLSAVTSADDAIANAAAFSGLGLGVAVSDTVGHVAADAAGLVALGSTLSSVTLTDQPSVLAATAAELAGLAGKLGGSSLLVADGANAVDSNRADLQTLYSAGRLASVHVTDTATAVAAVAPHLAWFGPGLELTLSGGTVDSFVFANLYAVMGNFDPGTTVDVSDVATSLWGRHAILVAMQSVLGTLTISDGNTVDAATAGSLAPLDGHLGLGVQLDVHDTAANIVAAASDLQALRADARLAAVVATSASAADVVDHRGVLAALGTQASITDDAATISADLDALQAFLNAGGQLDPITLTGGTVAVSVQQITTDAGVLASLPYHVAVQDLAQAITNDLADANSVLLANLANIDAITASDSGTLSLTGTQLLDPRIDGDGTSFLAKYSGGYAVTAQVGQLDAIALLPIQPASVAVNDTTGAIESDLQQASPSLVAHLALIGTITAGGGTITLTEAQARVAGVDDDSSSVFARLHGTAELDVTHVAAADVGVVAGLYVAARSIALDDSAPNIAANIAVLAANHALITGITVQGNGTITLSEAQATAAHVADSDDPVLAHIAGLSLAVTGVTVAQLAILDALSVHPTTIAVSDSTASIQADLESGSSKLIAHLGQLDGVTGSGGTLSLSVPRFTAADAVLARLSGATLQASGAAVADITVLLALARAPDTIAISDAAASIEGDLLGAGNILAHIGNVASIAATGDGIVTLAAADVLGGSLDPALAKLASDSLHITDAAIGDLATLTALGAPLGGVAIHDDAATIGTDLMLASPHMLDDPGLVTGISFTDIGTPTLTLGLADLTRDASLLSLITDPYDLAISDTTANLQAALQSGAADLIGLGSHLVGITGDAGMMSLSYGQATAAGISGILGKISNETLTVTGVPAADFGTIQNLPLAPLHIAVTDTAAGLAAELANASSPLISGRTLISGITLSDSGIVHLTADEALVPGVADGVAPVLGNIVSLDLDVTHATAAQVGALMAQGIVPTSIEVSDTAAGIQADTGTTHYLSTYSGLIQSIEVTNVAVIDLATLGSLVPLPDSVVVTDSPTNIGSDLSAPGSSNLVNSSIPIASIVLDVPGTVAVAPAGLHDAGVLAMLDKLPDDSVAATGLAVDDIAIAAGLGARLHGMDVSDTAGKIQADITIGSHSILDNLAAITGIVATLGTITLTASEIAVAGVDDGPGSALALLSGAELTVTDVAIGGLAGLMLRPHAPDHVTILDTAAHIAAQLTTGLPGLQTGIGQITAVTVSDSNPIELTKNQALAGGDVATVLAVTHGTLEVSGVDVGSLTAVAGIITAATLQIDVSDTASNIEAELGVAGLLVTNRALLHDVHAIGGALSLSVAEVTAANVDDGGTAALAHLSSGLIVTGALVADLTALAGLTVPATEIDISDSSEKILADLTGGASKLASLGSGLGTLASSNSHAMTLTDTQVQVSGVAGALAHLSGAALDITGAPVADIAAMAALTAAPASLYVLDSAAAVTTACGQAGAIATHASSIASVAVSDGTLHADAAAATYDALAALSVAFDESNLVIDGTAAQLLAAAAGHAAMLSAAQSVALNADALGLTAADAAALDTLLGGDLNSHQLTIADTGANLMDPASASAIALASSVSLSVDFTGTAQQATDLVAIAGFSAGGHGIGVQDTATNLLNPSYAAGIAAASSVTLNASCAVDAGDLATLIAMTGFAGGGHQITLQDTAAHILGAGAPLLGHANVVDVADSAANIVADLSALPVLLGHSYGLAISVNGAAPNVPSLAVTAADYASYQATLDKVDMAGIVKVTGSAAELAVLAGTLHNDVAVGEVDVADTANNILANLPALEAIGAKFSGVNLSNATVNAAAVASLLSIQNVTATNLTILDTGSQIAAAITANGAAAVNFMDNQTVQLSADSVVTAGDAKALESLSSLSKNGHQLSVWDTATHLTDSIDGYLAAVSNAIVDHVYLRTTSGSATVSASTASALFTIPHFSRSNPDSSGNSLIVQDTAAHIVSSFASLSGHSGQLSSVVVSGSATVTDSVFGNLLALNATKLSNVEITVRDTAANIIAGAPGQIGGSPSITPLAWMLSGSATVDEVGLAQLGSLPRFSAGAYTLTLSRDAGIGVSNANAIGTLGSAYRAGIHTLTVAGTVADVLGLTTAARAIVVPHITDTFGNIALLTPTSGLLGGTIAVTDSESVSVTQAAAFLALLKVGSGPGIPAANVDFAGHTQTVADTLANIQTLTGAAAWQQNAGVQSDFSLTVADTVAHLVAPANAAALAAMASTTLLGDQTASAADAEALFAVKNAIHFSVGSNVLTVQDTAAHLLDPVYLDGVNMASVLLLAASDTVSAADAEALMAMGSFQIINPNTILTISDSSDALLDGTLATALAGHAYASHIEVQLSSPETLDAQTAHRLVNLAHFNDNGDLSIQDSASYLLNAANLDAEQAATSVILAGDETVSAATAAHLAAVPHFDLGGFTLHLASNDFADAATLKTITDFGTGFDPNGHTLTMTQDVLNLTPDEYAAAQADNLATNGHALSAIPVDLLVTATGGSLGVDGSGVEGATVTLYNAAGSAVDTIAASPSFHVSAADAGTNMVLTETVGPNAATSESAPMVLLEQAALEGIVNTDGASFAASGAVHVAGSEYLDIYNASAAPAHPGNPVLVYDPAQHTLSLDVDGHAAVVLVTLGTATHAASLDAGEIFMKHQLG